MDVHAAQRPRREVSGGLITITRPLLRFSRTRQAYVLRGVGNRMGPVLVRRRTSGDPAAPTRSPSTPVQ